MWLTWAQWTTSSCAATCPLPTDLSTALSLSTTPWTSPRASWMRSHCELFCHDTHSVPPTFRWEIVVIFCNAVLTGMYVCMFAYPESFGASVYVLPHSGCVCVSLCPWIDCAPGGHACVHSHTHTCTHACIRTHTHTHLHVYTHTHTHTHTHRHSLISSHLSY